MTQFKFKLNIHVRDKVTGFSGTVLGRTEYATGCIQYGICPNTLIEGKFPEWQWLDESRLEIISKPAIVGLKAQGGPHPRAPEGN